MTKRVYPLSKRIIFLILIVFSIFYAYAADLDLDGMNDAWETLVGLDNTNSSDASYDNDSDSLTNLWEYKLGFHPFNNNSDSNYTIFNESTNAILDAYEDLDGDTLTNLYEITKGTSPLSNDTDNDGVHDQIEIAASRDPTVGISYNQDKTTLKIAEQIQYKINLTSTNQTYNTTLAIILPTGLVFTSQTNNASVSHTQTNQNISFNLQNLSGLTKYNFTINAYLNNSPANTQGNFLPPTQINLYYQNKSAANKLENQTTLPINIIENYNSVSLTKNTSIVQIGEIINFTLGLTNFNNESFNITINTYLEDGLDYLSSNIAPTTQSGNNLTFKFVNSSTLQNIQILTEVNSTYDNSESVLANDNLSISMNISFYSVKNLSIARYYTNQSSNNIKLSPATISISSPQTNATIGQTINYTILYDFTQAPANNIHSNVTIPTNLEYKSHSSSITTDFENIGTHLNFNFTNITSTQIIELNISFIVNKSAIAGNTFFIYPNITYTDTSNNFYTDMQPLTLQCTEPNLQITKNLFSPVSVKDLLTYTITITNNGNSTTYNTTLIETIANGTQLISSQPAYTYKTGTNNETIQFNISNIAPTQTRTINLTVNITENYFDGNYILSNDTLTFSSNLSYQSVQNNSLARKYNTILNDNTTIQEGAITKQTNASITINTNPTARIGEEFLYQIIINFTGAPANTVTITDYLPTDITLVKTNNTLNDSAFSQTGQLLTWTFGNLTPATKIIYINITAYINNSASNTAGTLITNNANLTYSNTLGSSILKQDSSNIYIAEPNINITTTLQNTQDLAIGDLIDYTINISNWARPINNYNSQAYNITLTQPIPNGLIFNYSSLAPTSQNTTELTFNIVSLNVNQSQIINLRFEVNQTYRNSTNVLSEDTFTNFAQILAYSFSNQTIARTYTKNFTTNSIKIASPILNTSNNSTLFSIGDTIYYTTIINLSQAPANNINITHQIPNGLDIINTQTNSNISFSQNTNTLFWEYGNLTTQTIFTINVTTRINNSNNLGDNLQYITNLSYTSANHTQFNIIETNTITVTEASLIITENIFSPVSVNDQLTYIINITNTGNSQAYNTTLIHQIPNSTIIQTTSPIFTNKTGLSNQTLTFNIGTIPNATSLQFNFTVNITDKYWNNNFVLANDTLFAYTNLTYQSHPAYTTSRKYFNTSIATTTIQEGAIIKNTTGTITINSNQATRIGELFNYTILINFTGAPANTVTVDDRLPAYITLISQNNSLNNTAFNYLGNNLLQWTFGDLNSSTKTIRINISCITNNSAPYIAGNTITNNANLTYTNIHGSSILKQDSSNIEIVEHNLRLDNQMLNTLNISIGQLINYTINLTNIENNLMNYYSPAYNITITEHIPNGLIFNYSSVAPTTQNSTHITYNLATLNLNQTQFIELRFNVNKTYRNGTNVLSKDTIQNNVSVTSQSILNWQTSRQYFEYNLTSFIQIASPQITISLNNTNLSIGELTTAQILLNFTNTQSDNVNVTLSIPNGLEYISSQAQDNTSFTQNPTKLIWHFDNITVQKLYSINATFITNTSLNIWALRFFNTNLSYTSSNNTIYKQTDSASLTMQEPILQIYIYDVPAKEVGDNATYFINITNIGTSTARNITFITIIPNATSYISSQPIENSQTGPYSNIIEHKITNINPAQTKTINLTILTLQNYTDNSIVRTGDILTSFHNLSYYSSKNQTYARYYTNQTNKSLSIASPELDISLNTSQLTNNLSTIVLGQPFKYQIIINFTDRSSTKALLLSTLPNNLTFVSQNNSLNNTAFSNLGNDLKWNFTNLNSTTEIIKINITAYAQNAPTNIQSTTLQSYYNLTYENSLLQEINKETLYDIALTEPNINFNITTNITMASLLDYVNYTITITNKNHSTNFSSIGHKLSLTFNISDGMNYISSNYPTANANIRNLTFNFTTINANQVIELNIITIVNDTLQNGSANNLSSITNDLKLQSYSSPNIAIARLYTNLSNITITTHDITKPTINSQSIIPKAVAITQNVTIRMNATDEIALDECWATILYPNTTTTTITNTCSGINFTTPSLIGTYNVTFFANDTSNNIANTTNTFRVGPPLIFNTSVIDDNLSGLNASVQIFVEGTNVLLDTNTSGNFSNTISTFIYDLLFSAFDGSFKVRLNSINVSQDNSEQIGLDMNTNVTGSLIEYGVLNNNYTFTNATVTISYANLTYTNENYLQTQVCANWNFTSRICLGTWEALSSTRNTVDDTFTFLRTSFSAFRIIEVIPPPSSGGGGSSSNSKTKSNMNITIKEEKCLEDWVCLDWEEDCASGIQKRTCFDNNKCRTFFDIPKRTRSCKIEDNSDKTTTNTSTIQKVLEKPTQVIKTGATWFEKLIKSSWTLSIVYILLILISFKMKHRIDDKISRDKVYMKHHKLDYYGQKINLHKRAWEMFIIGLLIVLFLTSTFVIISGLYIGLVFGIFCETAYLFYLHNHYNLV